jgi:hypothetical protein
MTANLLAAYRHLQQQQQQPQQHALSTMLSQHRRNQQLPEGIACSFLSVLSLLVRSADR